MERGAPRGPVAVAGCDVGRGARMGNHWQRHFTEHYFLTPPEEFSYDHFPDDARWQLLTQPLTRTQYEGLVALHPAFFEHGLAVVGPSSLRVGAGDSATFTFTSREEVQLSAELFSQGQEVGGVWTLCQGSRSQYQVLVRWPRAGSYRLMIFVKGRREPGELSEAAEYLIDARAGTPGGFPATYSSLGAQGASLREPLNGTLAAGRAQTFCLTVPGAREVNVVCNRQWHPLTKRGDEFVGSIRPAVGPVEVVADSWVLARYEAR